MLDVNHMHHELAMLVVSVMMMVMVMMVVMTPGENMAGGNL